MAYDLFGEAVFLPDTNYVLPDVYVCMNGIIATTYNRWRKQTRNFSRALERKRQNVQNLEEGEDARGRLTRYVSNTHSYLQV